VCVCERVSDRVPRKCNLHMHEALWPTFLQV